MEFIEQDIFAVLSADADLTALVDDRVYPLVAPDDVVLPMVSVQRISSVQTNSLSGFAGLERPRFQFSCYAESYGVAKQVARKLRAALELSTAVTAICTGDFDRYDAQTKTFSCSVDFYFWNSVDLAAAE